jgi:H+/gluconate symporter-like permease
MKILLAAILGAFSVVMALIPAQAIVFALAQYHINSGLTAPWLIVVALEAIVTAGILNAKYILED